MEPEILPHELREILGTLAFIGMARPGQKCFMEQRRFIDPLLWNDPMSWISWMSRRMGAESVVSNLKRIEKAIDDAIGALKDAKTVHRDLLLEHLALADGGLSSLEETYDGQPGTLATIAILRRQIGLLTGRPGAPARTSGPETDGIKQDPEY